MEEPLENHEADLESGEYILSELEITKVSQHSSRAIWGGYWVMRFYLDR